MIHRFGAYNEAMNTHSHDSYDVLSRFYDLEFDGFDADLAMYQQFARSMGGSMLELGCGSGRVLLALQDLGLPLTGIDDSQSMIELGRRRVSGAVTLQQQDMRALADVDGAPFSFVVCAVNTFLHLPDMESQLMTLDSVRRITSPEGALLLDVFVPDPQYLTTIDGRIEREFDTLLDDGSRLDKWVTRNLDLASQMIHTTVYYDVTTPNGNVSRSFGEYSTRYIHHFEMEHLLERSGWEIVSVYGGYDLHPFDSESERLIVLATPGRED
jgi:SAM-dependent methyltransferase